MSTVMMAEWEVIALDEEVTEEIQRYYRVIWNDEYGLSEEDALGAGCRASALYGEQTDWDEAQCLDRALDIAFEVKAEMCQPKEEIHG